jgi:hypothetical protein
MFGLLRLVVIGGAVLTVIYICLSIYSRFARRGKLAARWDIDKGPGARDDFIDAGMKDYDSSLRKKLILGVYVVPVSIIAVIIYLTNHA